MAACYNSSENSDADSAENSFPEIPIRGALFGKPLNSRPLDPSLNTPESKARKGGKLLSVNVGFPGQGRADQCDVSSEDSLPPMGKVNTGMVDSPIVLQRQVSSKGRAGNKSRKRLLDDDFEEVRYTKRDSTDMRAYLGPKVREQNSQSQIIMKPSDSLSLREFEDGFGDHFVAKSGKMVPHSKIIMKPTESVSQRMTAGISGSNLKSFRQESDFSGSRPHEIMEPDSSSEDTRDLTERHHLRKDPVTGELHKPSKKGKEVFLVKSPDSTSDQVGTPGQVFKTFKSIGHNPFFYDEVWASPPPDVPAKKGPFRPLQGFKDNRQKIQKRQRGNHEDGRVHRLSAPLARFAPPEALLQPIVEKLNLPTPSSQSRRVLCREDSFSPLRPLREYDTERHHNTQERVREKSRKKAIRKDQQGIGSMSDRLTSTILGKNTVTTPIECSDDDEEDLFSSGNEETVAVGKSKIFKKRRSHEKMKEEKLSDDHIKTTTRKYCCKNSCLINLDSKGIREAREKYYRMKSQDASLSLQWMVKRNDNEGGSFRIRYTVGQVNVCRSAFKAVFSVGNHRIRRMVQLSNKSISAPISAGRPESMSTLLVISWMETFFKTRVESMPNKDNIVNLPDNYTKLEVHKIFQSEFRDLDPSADLDYRQFCRIWKKHFSHVRIPAVNRFSCCADCEEFKSLRDKAVIAEEKKKAEMMLDKHREQQSKERLKLAKHRKKCIASPEKYMGVVIDGMDQKKTRLPHWPRPPKSVDESCLIQLHVVGCLVFNGSLHSRVFLNYPTLHNDGNLTVTILHKVLLEWEARPGGLPPVLYLQLDNTSRENKNNLLFTYLHMLVKYKIFKKIKLGFLLVGHTHDQIDQMFSRFSTKLSKAKAFTYEALCAIILESYKPVPVITLVRETYDFRIFAFGEPNVIIHNLHNIKFLHQYKICRVADDDIVPTMWAKKFSTSEVWKPKNGVKLLKDEIPEKIMSASLGMGLVRKGDRIDGKSHSKATPAEVLETSLAEVEKGILACERYFSVDDMAWWKIFFEEQRMYNIALLAQARPLKEPFRWPRSRDHAAEVEEIPLENIDLNEINSRVYGPDREIYVGPYRPQRDLDREKENLEGDFSDLILDTFLCVASDDTNTPFWLAKVEKIISFDDKNIPEIVSVLWHALKKDADPYDGKYLPEVLDYEKKKSGKGKGTKQPIWHHAEINLKETTVYAYNFFLKKSDTMYLNTVKRIKIKLKEFEDDTTDVADCPNEREQNENEEGDCDDERGVDNSSSEGDSIPYSLDDG